MYLSSIMYLFDSRNLLPICLFRLQENRNWATLFVTSYDVRKKKMCWRVDVFISTKLLQTVKYYSLLRMFCTWRLNNCLVSCWDGGCIFWWLHKQISKGIGQKGGAALFSEKQLKICRKINVFTLLKWKNESNSTWVIFNSFP